MKRLQFRHHEDIFASRADALQYFADIVDTDKIASTEFGTTLFSEPMVAKYLDENQKPQIIVGIGVDSGNTPYHLIDTADLAQKIADEAIRATEAEKQLSGAVQTETERAINAENALSGAVQTETERAMNAENALSGMLQSEIERATEAENDLKEQISNNIVKIKTVSPSSDNILEEYALTNEIGEPLGENIKIYKDIHIIGATFGFKGVKSIEESEDGSFILTYDESSREDTVEYLYLVYKDSVGNIAFIGVNFEDFLQEKELKNGFEIQNHEISVKIKTDDPYLGIDETGIYTKGISEAIDDAAGNLSTEITEKIDNEIARSTAADEYISGLTSAFSASVISALTEVKETVTAETDRATAAESALSGAIETEIARAKEAESALSASISANQIDSKDVVLEKTETGTVLTIQTDEVTITKYASASTIYDTSVAVLGTLLRIKQVEDSDPEIKYHYELQDANGRRLGEPITISSESSLYKVEVGYVGDAINPDTGEYSQRGPDVNDKSLNFIYHLSDGKYTLVAIRIADYFTDSHFGRGLNNQDGVVSIVEGDDNEFLVIGEDTLAVVGVSKAIEEATLSAIGITHAAFSALTHDLNSKYDSATAFTQSKFEEATGMSNTQIGDLTNQLNEKFTEATALTEQRYSEATGLTQSRFSAVTNDLNTKYDSAVTMANEQYAKATGLTQSKFEEATALTENRYAAATGLTESRFSAVTNDLNTKYVSAVTMANEQYAKATGLTQSKFEEATALTESRVGDVSAYTEAKFTEATALCQSNFTAATSLTQSGIDKLNGDVTSAFTAMKDYYDASTSFTQSKADEASKGIASAFTSIMEAHKKATAFTQTKFDEANVNINSAFTAINNAKAEASAYTDSKYAQATALTENRYSSATAYTDTKIADVTSSIDSLSENLTKTLTESIANVNNSLTAETQNRETADADILAQLRTETSERTSANSALREAISSLSTTLRSEIASANTAINDDIDVLSGLAHSHANKTILDTISDSQVKDWNRIVVSAITSVAVNSVALPVLNNGVNIDLTPYAEREWVEDELDSMSANVSNVINSFSANTVIAINTLSSNTVNAINDLSANTSNALESLDDIEQEIITIKPKAADNSITVGSPEADGTPISVKIRPTDNAIKVDDNGIYVSTGDLKTYVGADAINVVDETISLRLDSTDKILSQNGNGLMANISLQWDKAEGLKLLGKDSSVIATVPATDFIKDGMLENVTLETDPSGQTPGTYLHFTFNSDSGKADIFLDVSELGLDDKLVELSGATSAIVSTLEGKLNELSASTISFSSSVVTNYAISGDVFNHINTVDSKISSVENKVNSLSASVMSNYATSADTHNAIQAIGTKVNEFSAATDARFEEVISSTGTFNTSLTELSASVVNNYVTSANVHNTINNFSAATDARLDAIEEATGTLNTSITNFSASVVNNYATSADTYAEIDALKQRVSELESQLDSLSGNLSTTIEEAVKAYIIGTTHQISVNDTGSHLTIGFDQNAIFGDQEDF